MKKLLVSIVSLMAVIISYGQTVSYGTYAGVGGNQNAIFGYGAGFSVLGDGNTIVGHNAGTSLTTGSQNTFLGTKAGYFNSTAVQNHFVGFQSGYSNTVGFLNHFDGYNSGYSNITGSENQFIGHSAGYLNTVGNGNLFIGYIAGRENTTASNNQFIGNRAGGKNTTGSNNYFSGYQSGYNNTSGNNNYFSGFRTGFSNVSGSGNLFIGNNAGYYETGSNKIYIDNSATTQPLIYGDFSSDILTINGKLGINSIDPSRALEVNGDISLPSFSGNKQIFTWHPLDVNWRIGMSASPGFSRSIATGHVQYLTFWDGPGQGFAVGRNAGESSFEIAGSNHSAFFRGNVGIGINPEYKLHVVNAYCDGNTWYNVSDKNMKENFARIKPSESILDKVMELPIQYWNYKGDNSNRHIGPTAQDFHKVFQLGSNEKAISTIDESGVALAAIQELTQQTRDLKKMLDEQQQLISSLLQTKIESLGSEESGLKLHQNQPNPFQRDTKITMEIPQKVNQAVLYIYDLQGKIAGQQTVPGRGTTSVIIEGGRLNSGMYLYVLIGDGKATEAKRMILTE